MARPLGAKDKKKRKRRGLAVAAASVGAVGAVGGGALLIRKRKLKKAADLLAEAKRKSKLKKESNKLKVAENSRRYNNPANEELESLAELRDGALAKLGNLELAAKNETTLMGSSQKKLKGLIESGVSEKDAYKQLISEAKKDLRKKERKYNKAFRSYSDSNKFSIYSPYYAEFNRKKGSKDKGKRKRRRKRLVDTKPEEFERSRNIRSNIRVANTTSREIRGWTNTTRGLLRDYEKLRKNVGGVYRDSKSMLGL